MHFDLKSIPVRMEEAAALVLGAGAVLSAEIAQETNSHILGLTPRQLGWAAVIVFSTVWFARFSKGVADFWRKFDHTTIPVGLASVGSGAQVLAAGVAAVITQTASAQFAGLSPQDYGKITAFSLILGIVGRVAQGVAQLVGPVITVFGGSTPVPVPIDPPNTPVEPVPPVDVSDPNEDMGDAGSVDIGTS